MIINSNSYWDDVGMVQVATEVHLWFAFWVVRGKLDVRLERIEQINK